MNWEQSKKALDKVGIGENLTHQGTETSSVTTAWGVEWDEAYIARDIMQNFFDANRERLSEVRVEESGGAVRIWGPEAFNLERLFFLGSEKGDDDIGHYGEGFKVAATCLLRDHDVTPLAWSGNQVLAMRIADETVADTRLRPLIYDFFASEASMEGTMLLLPGCSKKMAGELKKGLNHFFHAGNPLIGDLLWQGYGGHFAVYESGDSDGHIFYRNLKRGEMDGIPLVLVINKEYKSIENKISKDRDRNAFGGDLMKLFYRTFARSGLKGDNTGIKVVLGLAKTCWTQGHSLLSAIAETSWRQRALLEKDDVEELFGDDYYAQSHTRDALARMSYEEIESQWDKEGRTRLPGYFASFGVISAERHCKDIKERAKKESMAENSRTPTPAEMASISVLKHIIKDICPGIMGVFENSEVTFTVAKTEVILGELRKGRAFWSHEVFLAEEVFVSDFADGLAVFLHEHAHVFGHDGSRSFTDALTRILAVVIRERNALSDFETEWEEARGRVLSERKRGRSRREDSDLQSLLASLDEGELRDLLGMVPSMTLKSILNQQAA